jgi:hypothetical protein
VSKVGGEITIRDPLSTSKFRALRSQGRISRLIVNSQKRQRLTVLLAVELAVLEVDWLRLWIPVSRTAFSRAVQTLGLRHLEIFELVGPGQLRDVAAASQLEELFVCYGLTEHDLAAISRSSSITHLSAHNAKRTQKSIRALTQMQTLQHLDIECTAFNDEMAELISHSQSITTLDVGATELTGLGLSYLCRMKQLKEIDLWATAITLSDLELLQELPRLERLTLGYMSRPDTYDPDGLVELLLRLPTLRVLWLDGVKLPPHQLEALLARFPDAKITIEEE